MPERRPPALGTGVVPANSGLARRTLQPAAFARLLHDLSGILSSLVRVHDCARNFAPVRRPSFPRLRERARYPVIGDSQPELTALSENAQI